MLITVDEATMKPSYFPLSRAQAGFTLVEALVTFLILAIGLLGLAGLQAKGLQFDQSAYQRTQAVLLAADISDRMRANLATARASSYTVAFGDAVSSTANCNTSTCTVATMAKYDLTQWKIALAQLLPRGDGKIVTTAGVAPAVTATITVHWDELHSGVTGTACPGDPKTDFACLEINVALQDPSL